MSSAAEEVFAIPELCIPILHDLSTKDLLLAQRVCKQWKSTIENSQKLQRALFFQPVDLPLVKGKPRLPLIPGLGNYKSELLKRGWNTSNGEDDQIVFGNPLLASLLASMPCCEGEGREDLRVQIWYQLPQAWKSVKASWRRMLFTQPAVEMDWKTYTDIWDDMIGPVLDTKKIRAFGVFTALCDDQLANHDVPPYHPIDWAKRFADLESNEQIEDLHFAALQSRAESNTGFRETVWDETSRIM